ncbi:MAG: redoxin domain-containing protein [Candidatus Aenigmarchaeota archaeon]|nr:redoxin domain-containing protein [Candidatus Aenigmarchaeota archaeon]
MDEELKKIRERKMKDFMEKQSFPDKPLEVRDRDLDDIVGRYPVVVVDFWSEHCPPCKMIAPVLEELAKELQGRVVFGKVCVDSEMLMARKFSISAIPTLLVFRKGSLTDTIVGYASKDALMEKLKRHLG